MNKIYYLATCSTCNRIIKELGRDNFTELINIKNKPIDEETLEAAKAQLGSYEALFNKRAMKYRSMGLKELIKEDSDYKNYLLEEYTFLKRPLFDLGGTYISGNSKSVVAQVKEHLS